MANDFASNFTRPLMRVFLEKFESARVLSKNVDTQLFQGRFNPSTGDTVDVKRPTDYVSSRTPTGDITSAVKSDIITGKASAVVQDYFTVNVDYDEADEALKMDQLDELLAPMATRIVTDMETDFANFMMVNAGLLAGTPGTAVTTWDQVARAGAVLDTAGVPMDRMWNYAFNPFTMTKLASDQRSLGAGDGIVTSANARAVVTDNFAGMKVMSANTLATYTTDSEADRAGTLSATPDGTYVTAKDSMTQSLVLADFGADLVIQAGDVIEITGAAARNRLNMSTRKIIVDDAGAQIKWTATVTATVILSGTGTGTIVVTGPAINETDGQFNTVSSPLTSGDVVTVLGAASTVIQPNMFWHPKAFSIASIPIKKLFATDTVGTTEDGMQIRITKDSNFITNKQLVRFDFRPAYSVLNPFFAGHGHG